MNFSRSSGIGKSTGAAAIADEARRQRETRIQQREQRQWALMVLKYLRRWHSHITLCRKAMEILSSENIEFLKQELVKKSQQKGGGLDSRTAWMFYRCCTATTLLLGRTRGSLARGELGCALACRESPQQGNGEGECGSSQKKPPSVPSGGVCLPFFMWLKENQSALISSDDTFFTLLPARQVQPRYRFELPEALRGILFSFLQLQQEAPPSVAAPRTGTALLTQSTRMLSLQLLFHYTSGRRFQTTVGRTEQFEATVLCPVVHSLCRPPAGLPSGSPLGVGVKREAGGSKKQGRSEQPFFEILQKSIRSAPTSVVKKTLSAVAFQLLEYGLTNGNSAQIALVVDEFSRHILTIPRLLDTLLAGRSVGTQRTLFRMLSERWQMIFGATRESRAQDEHYALGNLVHLGLKSTLAAESSTGSTAPSPTAGKPEASLRGQWLRAVNAAFGYSTSHGAEEGKSASIQGPSTFLASFLASIEKDGQLASPSGGGTGGGSATLGDQVKVLWGHEGFPIVFESLVVSHAKQQSAESQSKEKEKKKKGFFAQLRASASSKKLSAEEQRLKALAENAVFTVPLWLPVAHMMLKSMTTTGQSTTGSSSIALNLLSRAPETLPPLWAYTCSVLPSFIAAVKNAKQIGDTQGPVQCSEAMLLTAYVSTSLFMQLFALFFTVLDDHEFLTLQVPFALETIKTIVEWANRLVVAIAQLQLPGGHSDLKKMSPSLAERLAILDAISRDDLRLRLYLRSVLRLLIDRNNRTQYVSVEEENTYWLHEHLVENTLFPGGGTVLPSSNVAMRLLFEAPHLVPFHFRVRYLQHFIKADRARHSADKMKYAVKIRRTHCLADGYEQIMRISSSDVAVLRARLHVTFIDKHGQEEAGIDAGGVYKEFMEVLLREAFNPQFGFWKAVEGSNELYPNPHSVSLFSTPQECYEQYRFLGRMLGKAIYESCVVPLYFAPFFLNNVLGRGNTLDDMKRFDLQQYRSLMQLKELEDVEDACIFFAVEEQFLGNTVVTDLVPNGREVPVTNESVVRYMHMCAHHRLFTSTQPHTTAFVSGLLDLLDRSWLALFNAAEIQQLISGSVMGNQKLNIEELKANTKLVGGYNMNSRSIGILFEVLEELSPADQAHFLRFVTGSSRPPLLGFAAMNPPFSIRRTEEGSNLNYVVDIDRLPTAATCFNLLKLPPYKSKTNLREKLLTAIRSEAGFDLS